MRDTIFTNFSVPKNLLKRVMTEYFSETKFSHCESRTLIGIDKTKRYFMSPSAPATLSVLMMDSNVGVTS
jgi:hypothetical protein